MTRRARTVRREQERTLQKLATAKEKLAAFDEGASPERPIPLESAAGLADLRRRQGPDDVNTMIVAGPDRSIAVITDWCVASGLANWEGSRHEPH